MAMDCVGRYKHDPRQPIDLHIVMQELKNVMDYVERMDGRLNVMNQNLGGRMEGLDKKVTETCQTVKLQHLKERELHESRLSGAERSAAESQKKLGETERKLEAWSKGSGSGSNGSTTPLQSAPQGPNTAELLGLFQRQLQNFAVHIEERMLGSAELERVLQEKFEHFGLRQQVMATNGPSEVPQKMMDDPKVYSGLREGDGSTLLQTMHGVSQPTNQADLIELEVVDPMLVHDFKPAPVATHWAMDGEQVNNMEKESAGDIDNGAPVRSNSQMSRDDIDEEMDKMRAEAAHDIFADEADNVDWDPEDDAPLRLVENDSLAGVFECDSDVTQRIHRVEEYYYPTGFCQALARSDRFANITVAVVIVNAVYIGIDADWNDSASLYHANPFFIIGATLFCVYFTFEWLVRFFAFRDKCHAFADGWFKFDTFLVVTMILDTWVLQVMIVVMGTSSVGSIPIQPLRMMRLFKLTRMARLMKAFPELVTMVKGLVRSLRAISSSGILIMLMLYTWAILLNNLLGKEESLNDEFYEAALMDFRTIPNCMWTLFMQGTLFLDNAGIMMTTLVYSKKPNVRIAGFAFFLFSLLSALLILQMLIGVLCDVVSRVGQEQRDAEAIGLVKQELLVKLRENAGDDGLIDQRELMKVMKSKDSKRVLKRLNINIAYLLELQKMMFPLKTSKASFKAVLEMMVMCRGENPATVQTLAGGFSFIARELEDVAKMITKLPKMYSNREVIRTSQRTSQRVAGISIITDVSGSSELGI